MLFPYLILSYAIILIIDSIVWQCIAPARDIVILYPAFFGGLELLMGFVSLKKELQAFGKHGATALSVIAFASSVPYFANIIQNISAFPDYAHISNSFMTLISLVFLILAVRQFAKERAQKG